MTENRFKELRDKALAPSGTYYDIARLAVWLLNHGEDRWNGESWAIDDTNTDDSLRLYPKLGVFVII